MSVAHDITAAAAITIVRARGRRLAKIIHPDGMIQAYDAARTVDLVEERIPDLAAVECLLRDLMGRRDCCIVRGAITDPYCTRGVRRLLYPDRETGDAPTLRDEPRHWLALDIDSIARPVGIAATNLAACATVAIEALPGPFRDVRCIIQATAGHGIKPCLRLRLWYWLSRPTSGAELRRWLRPAPVDHSVFGAAQPIYTAAPIFLDGARDPLPDRIATLPGMTEAVTVPAASAPMPPRRPTAPLIGKTGRTGRYGFAALVSATARVARANVGTRHATLLTEARGLGRLVESGALTARDVMVALSGAAGMAGLDDREAVAVIGWSLVHPAGARI